MSNSINFVQNGNNFLHGVRGVIYVDGEVAGAVLDISATESGEEDVIYTMGSRYIQAKEIKNKIVTGTIKTLVFDPTVQKLMKLTDPSGTGVIEDQANNPFSENSEKSNVLSYNNTQLAFSRTDQNSATPTLIPMFDIKVNSLVIDGTSGDTSYKGFEIKSAVIKSYEIMFNKDSFWLANIEYIADKIIRIGANNKSTA